MEKEAMEVAVLNHVSIDSMLSTRQLSTVFSISHTSICFSDECSFFVNVTVNCQNLGYWSNENPHLFREVHT